MTVKELIDKLSKMPQESLVVYQKYSEHVELENDEPKMVNDMIERNGTYFRFRPHWWDEKRDGQPKFLTVCVFPGN